MATIQPRQMLVDEKKHNIKCPYTMTAEYFTIHNSFNDASANNEITYMRNNTNQVSFHYAIDDVEVVMGIAENRNAFHAGDGNGNGNRKSIGIEICYSKSGGERYKKAEELTVQFVAQRLHARGWGIERVKKHQDWSGKYCPHRILSEGRWASFLARIEVALKALKTPPQAPAKPSTGNSIGTIKVLVDNLNYYNAPRWTNPSGQAKKNTVFTVMEKVKVEDGYQYRLKSGNYITAHTKYVTFTKQ